LSRRLVAIMAQSGTGSLVRFLLEQRLVKRRRLRAPFVVTGAAFVVACGASENDAPPACPATPPGITPAEQCTPEVQQAGGCRYSVTCQSGAVDLTFTCKPDGSSVVLWSVVPEACSFPQDTCAGTPTYCTGTSWATRPPANPPPLCGLGCPETKPAPGDARCLDCNEFCGCSGASCGYRCPSGEGWTVGAAYSAGSECTTGVWLFDGACAGDCSQEERALADYAQANKACATAADCIVLKSSCAFTKQSCGGAFYVNASTDAAKWNEYDAALSACAAEPASGFSCATCTAIDPEPDCVLGRCVPKT
jgi:hypothetical protein